MQNKAVKSVIKLTPAVSYVGHLMTRNSFDETINGVLR